MAENDYMGLFHPYEWNYGPLLITGFRGPPRNKHSPGLRTPIWTTGAKARVRGEGDYACPDKKVTRKATRFSPLRVFTSRVVVIIVCLR